MRIIILAIIVVLLSVSNVTAQVPSCALTVKVAAPAVLTWVNNATNNNGYNIYREVNGKPDATPISIVGATVLTYTDSTLVQDKLVSNTYSYEVTAVNAAGESGRSNKGCKTITQALPDGVPVLTIK